MNAVFGYWAVFSSLSLYLGRFCCFLKSYLKDSKAWRLVFIWILMELTVILRLSVPFGLIVDFFSFFLRGTPLPGDIAKPVALGIT